MFICTKKDVVSMSFRLHYYSGHKEIAKLLLRIMIENRRNNGERITGPIDGLGYTFLHFAAWIGNFESKKTVQLC